MSRSIKRRLKKLESIQSPQKWVALYEWTTEFHMTDEELCERYNVDKIEELQIIRLIRVKPGDIEGCGADAVKKR